MYKDQPKKVFVFLLLAFSIFAEIKTGKDNCNEKQDEIKANHAIYKFYVWRDYGRIEATKNFGPEIKWNQKNETAPLDSTSSDEAVTVISNNKWGITLTDKERELLSRIVWLEARGECDIGEQAVVEVIFNRMILYQESLYEVLSKKGQFTSWKSRNQANPTGREQNNIEKVLNGETDILRFSTIYFGTSPYNKKVYCKIEKHYFCDV